MKRKREALEDEGRVRKKAKVDDFISGKELMPSTVYEKIRKKFAKSHFAKKDTREKFILLDAWYQQKLPIKIRARKYLRRKDLIKIMEWKLLRGKWRPRLLNLIKSNPADLVQKHTKKVFAEFLDNPHDKNASDEQIFRGIKALCKLKGVGPATASAILSAVCKDVPFMSDEVMQQILGKVNYTHSHYCNLLRSLKESTHKQPSLPLRQLETLYWCKSVST